MDGLDRGQASADADDYLGDIVGDFLTKADGEALISQIEIDPTAILQKALANHDNVTQQWAQFGTSRAGIIRAAFDESNAESIVSQVKEAGGDELIATVETVREAVATVAADKASVEQTVTDAKAEIAGTIATGKDDIQAIADAAAASSKAASESAQGAQQSATTATSAATTAKSEADRATTEADKLENWNDLAGALDKVTDKDVKWKGALEVGREVAKDSELVTLRQLNSATSSGGTGGPTMNGVMNNALGAPVWFNGTRAKIWPGHQPADGQLAKRADFPEIWAAIQAGIFVSVDNEKWQSDPTIRAAYSDGDGSTTFRFPDLNGMQPTLLDGPFLRGDAGGVMAVGDVQMYAAPNITGGFVSKIPNGHAGKVTGAFSGSNGAAITPDTATALYSNIGGSGDNTDPQNYGYMFQASRSNPTYGRADEVRPNAAVGIWVIRVNGIFTASDTNFNVIIADKNLPGAGSVVYGGAVPGDKLGSSVWEFDSEGVLKAPTTTVKSEDVAVRTLRIRDTAVGTSSAEFNIGFKAGDVSQLIANYTSNVKGWDFNGIELNGAGLVRSYSGFEGASVTGALKKSAP